MAMSVARDRPWCGNEVEFGEAAYVAPEGFRFNRKGVGGWRKPYAEDEGTLAQLQPEGPATASSAPEERGA